MFGQRIRRYFCSMNDKKIKKLRIGPRTIKTAVAVTIAMLIVNSFGASTSKLIFAILGAMGAMEVTFKDSIKVCLTQIIGVLFGGIASILLLLLPIPPLATAVVGIVMVIVCYNILNIQFSPSLPALIVVIVCTTPDIYPLSYAFERIWDTTIGLGVGIIINLSILPYDNSRKIRQTVESLDRELILFLEEMFDGDNILPDVGLMENKLDFMRKQLQIFSNQKFLWHKRRRKMEYDTLLLCEGKARQLLIEMEVLARMSPLGTLNDKNRALLIESGAKILDEKIERGEEIDIVTNYHVGQIIILRKELMNSLGI